MLFKIKKSLFGNRMSRTTKDQLTYFLQYEHKFGKTQAQYLVESGEWKKILGVSK